MHKPNKRIALRHTAALVLMSCVMLFAPGAVFAQTYPDKPIRIIVGPGPDTLARIVGERLTEAWGQTVVIDQRPAAGGIVAGDAVAKAAPDGHTLLLSTGSFTINSVLQVKSPYDFQRDLTPVSLMATLAFVLVVNPALPANSLKELLTLVRSQPGKLNYASGGNGTPPHLAGEMLKQMAKIEMQHIPYKSAAAGVTDVAGGQVQMMFVPAPTALPLIKSGRLRALAVSSPQRYAGLPEVPTVAEEGMAEFSIVGWNGLHVPAKTPAAVIEKLNREIMKMMRQRETQERAMAAGLEPVGSTQEEFIAFQRRDIARATAVIKAANIQPD